MEDEIIKQFIENISGLNEFIKEMYLFGSRCRNDWKPDSDYDILIVLDKKDRMIIDKLYDVVIDILINTGRLISLKIFTLDEYNHLKSMHTPFISNILNEGIGIGFNN